MTTKTIQSKIETIETSAQGTLKLVQLTTLGDCFGVAKCDSKGRTVSIAWSTEGSARQSFEQAAAKEVQA